MRRGPLKGLSHASSLSMSALVFSILIQEWD